jgi:hypothetical protein
MTLRLGLGIVAAICALVAVWGFSRPGFWPRVFRAAGRHLATLGRYLMWPCPCPECRRAQRRKRDPGPSHPAARVIRARRLDLTDEQARIRWQQISEKQLGAQLRTPQPRDGSQR